MPSIDFELDAQVLLPTQFTDHLIRGMHLLIVAERPTWIVLNDAEFDAFKQLSKRVTVRELLNSHPQQ